MTVTAILEKVGVAARKRQASTAAGLDDLVGRAAGGAAVDPDAAAAALAAAGLDPDGFAARVAREGERRRLVQQAADLPRLRAASTALTAEMDRTRKAAIEAANAANRTLAELQERANGLLTDLMQAERAPARLLTEFVPPAAAARLAAIGKEELARQRDTEAVAEWRHQAAYKAALTPHQNDGGLVLTERDVEAARANVAALDKRLADNRAALAALAAERAGIEAAVVAGAAR